MDLKSTLTGAKEKDEFLNKAHKARQARELARKQDKAATILQAHVRKFLVLRQVKRNITDDHEQLLEGNLESDNLLSLHRILFFCDCLKDKSILESSLTSLHHKLLVEKPALAKSATDKENEPPKDEKEIELSHKNIPIAQMESRPIDAPQNFAVWIMEMLLKDKESCETCDKLLRRLLKTCFRLLDTCLEQKSSPQPIVTYLQLVNFLAGNGLLNLIRTVSKSQQIAPESMKSLVIFLETIRIESHRDRKLLFMNLSDSICKLTKGSRNEAKSSLLREYTASALNLLDVASKSPADRTKKTPWTRDDGAEIFIKLMTVPALIHYLAESSPVSLDLLREESTFCSLLTLLTDSEQRLQALTSTPALCLVGNLIHLSSLNEHVLVSEMMTVVGLITKLLEICQKNMKSISSTQVATRKSNRKANESTDESYNHILGWLTREQSFTIDQELSKMIKMQLNHLWGMKFLKILLNDLIKTNEQNLSSDSKKDAIVSNSKLSATAPRQRCSADTMLSRRIANAELSQLSSGNNHAPLSSFKRVVERAALSMTKSISNSYVKTAGSPGSHSSSAKLVTAEARRIALVCSMLHTSLKTLKMIKQDILTGLCFHDYVLCNLWTFISSLSSQNGLKAFIDYLALHTKTSMPEFHILLLFCECASHIISILDDSELYEQQRPFSIEDLINISAFLNTFVFRILSNQLVIYNAQDMDPILQSTHKLLTDLYKRDCRRKFAPQDHWLIRDVKMSLFLKDLDAGKPVAQAILTLLPHIIPHKERVLIFRKLVARDRTNFPVGDMTFITIHRSRIVEDGYQQLARLPPNALKGLIRVKFINDHGLDEAGIDQDGVFKEFLEDTIKRVFDPALNLFCTTSEQRIYPSPTSRLHEDHLSLFNFVGKVLGKALYEGIVVDVPFASFFLSRVLGQHQSALYSPIDELPSLDPELYKSLTYIKHFEGDVSELDLTFSIDQDILGKIETYELEAGGKFMPVTKESRVRYIHSVANFRMKTQIEEQTEAFVRGFKSVINLEWLHMFSASELQRLISGDTAPIDLIDLRKHTKYFGGFHNNHRVICWLWDILEKDFSAEEHSLFLKFVTSCSKSPLLGFANLEPPFSIRCVEVSDDQDSGDTVGSVLRGFFAIRRSDPVDRLPTSSTCFNLLKLPNYQRRSTLREKLRYAICSNPGFELS